MRGGGEANLKVYHGSRHGPWWHDHAVSLPWGALDLYLLTCGTVQQRRPRVREEQALGMGGGVQREGRRRSW